MMGWRKRWNIKISGILKSRRLRLLPGMLLVSGIIVIFSIDARIRTVGRLHTTRIEDAPSAQAAIVLGAYVKPNGEPCPMLHDRINTGVALYKTGKVKKLLMSGDHGQTDYDEVNCMRRYALEKGVPPQDIFMDHAGFCTYDSIYRARKIFQVESALIVTQDFHLARAIYIARKMGISAWGVSSDTRTYEKMKLLEKRDFVARIKDFFFVNVTKPKPYFLGEVIPIDGDGRATCDIR